MFSRRTDWDLSPNAFASARNAAGALLDLTESNPTRVQLPYPEQEILAALASPGALAYDPRPFGLPAARQAVASHMGVLADRIVLTASSSEAYAWLLKLLCDAGDNVLVPRPSYPLFDDLARVECVELHSYGLLYDGRWHVDPGSMRSAVDARTRAIFIVSPNNPTGSCLRRSELEAIEQLAREQELALVCDEVFAEYVWRDHPDRVGCLAAESSLASFSLGGLSKSACLPQMKLGWIAVGGPPWLAEQALERLEMIADTFLSVGTPVQHAAARLIATRCTARDALRARIRANLATLQSEVPATSPVSVLETEAGWYAVLRVPGIMTDEQWSVALMQSDAVLVHPGSFFGFDGEGWLVVSLIPEPGVFKEAIRKVVARVAAVCG
jgi:alanine-synthesizing transaminase